MSGGQSDRLNQGIDHGTIIKEDALFLSNFPRVKQARLYSSLYNSSFSKHEAERFTTTFTPQR